MGRAPDPHLIDTAIQRLLGAGMAAFTSTGLIGDERGEIPCVLAKLLDVEWVAGASRSGRLDGLGLEVDM